MGELKKFENDEYLAKSDIRFRVEVVNILPQNAIEDWNEVGLKLIAKHDEFAIRVLKSSSLGWKCDAW